MMKEIKKFYKALTAMDIIAWIITGLIMVVVQVVELNNATFRMVWSDMTRYYDVHSSVSGLIQVVLGLM